MDAGQTGHKCGLLKGGIELSEANHYLGANFIPRRDFEMAIEPLTERILS
jgi:hypothetical protein